MSCRRSRLRETEGALSAISYQSSEDRLLAWTDEGVRPYVSCGGRARTPDSPRAGPILLAPRCR